jgi:hypothetical protein
MVLNKDEKHNNFGYKNRLKYITVTYPKLKQKARETHIKIIKSSKVKQIKDFNEPDGWLVFNYNLDGSMDFQESKNMPKRTLGSSKFMEFKE